MNLFEIAGSLTNFDQEATIYAHLPWSPDSMAIVDFEPDEGGVPVSAEKLGLAYFLEVSVASEVLEDMVDDAGYIPTQAQMCDRMIKYAVDDA